MPGLVTFKRRAAGYVERDTPHNHEDLTLLFAPNSTFENGQFGSCKMNLALFNGATLSEFWIEETDLVSASFRGATITNTTFTQCSLIGASFEGARLRKVRFFNCNLTGATFLQARLQSEVTFLNCKVDDADLRFYESEAGAPSFVNTHLRGVSLNINCEFWNGTFDEVATADFGRLFARASQDPEIIELAKRRWGAEAYDRLDAYMRRD